MKMWNEMQTLQFFFSPFMKAFIFHRKRGGEGDKHRIKGVRTFLQHVFSVHLEKKDDFVFLEMVNIDELAPCSGANRSARK